MDENHIPAGILFEAARLNAGADAQSEAHLEHCSMCAGRLAWMKMMAQFGPAESAFEPPESAVESAVSLARDTMVLQRLRSAVTARLTFDSFTGALEVRHSHTRPASRHLSYDAVDVEIGIWIRRPDENTLALAGQVTAKSPELVIGESARVARRMFEEQGNLVRTAAIDVYRAAMRLRLGQCFEARRLARAASAAFVKQDAKAKAALACIVSMKASLKLLDFEAASREAAEAVALHDESPLPWIGLQLHSAIGELHLAHRRFEDARRAFRKALAESERLRSNIDKDELRMSFLKDKIPVYELLVKACLRSGNSRHRREAFETLERAKSRTLADLLAGRIQDSNGAASSSLEDIQKTIPDDAALIEYFVHDDDVGVFCVTAREFEVVEKLSSYGAVREHFEFLQYQMAAAAVRAGRVSHARGRLRELYRLLALPLEPCFGDRGSLVFVPCGLLHGIPWPALFDGERYLTERFRISCSPSAHVYRLFANNRPGPEGTPLIVGVNGRRTPHIAAEVEAIRSVLPAARTLVGAEATVDRVVEEMTHASLIHIAGHATFRADRAMFSSIDLHDGPLNCFDLFAARTPAALVTLSGCGTGLTQVVRGDELLGLIRGFLYAGAASFVASLWDVHDRTTADLMKQFYGCLMSGFTAAESLQLAMARVREEHLHPYYWAPFLLMGNLHSPKKI